MGWLSLLLKGGLWLVGLIWPAKDQREEERKAGERLGQQETENKNAQTGLKEVQTAVNAERANRERLVHDLDSLRDGKDPAAKPYEPGPD